MRILITGVCGFVGSKIALALKSKDPAFDIIGLDNLSRSGSWINKTRLLEAGIQVMYGDIRNASDLEGIAAINWVIDAAANPSVLAGVDGKTSSRQLIEYNLQGTINLLEICKRDKAGFILLSTSRVYSIAPLAELLTKVENSAFIPDPGQAFLPGLSTEGVAEAFSVRPPISLYGCTKLNSEQLALEYGYTFDFPVWINRCGVMAGAGQFGHPGQGIFSYWVHSFKEKQPLKYIGFGGTGYQVRDCLHPDDLTGLLLQQMFEPKDSKKERTVNVSGGVANSCSLFQLTQWCAKRFGDMKVVSSDSVRPFDIPWMVLDASKAEEIWGWKPTTTLDQVLDQIAFFAETQTNWCDLSKMN